MKRVKTEGRDELSRKENSVVWARFWIDPGAFHQAPSVREEVRQKRDKNTAKVLVQTVGMVQNNNIFSGSSGHDSISNML